MKAIEISQAILNSDLTFGEMNGIIEAINLKRKMIGAVVKSELYPGVNVVFTSTKLGGKVTGSVVKVMTKNVLVNCGAAGQWRVPASMLTVA